MQLRISHLHAALTLPLLLAVAVLRPHIPSRPPARLPAHPPTRLRAAAGTEAAAAAAEAVTAGALVANLEFEFKSVDHVRPSKP